MSTPQKAESMNRYQSISCIHACIHTYVCMYVYIYIYIYISADVARRVGYLLEDRG